MEEKLRSSDSARRMMACWRAAGMATEQGEFSSAFFLRLDVLLFTRFMAGWLWCRFQYDVILFDIIRTARKILRNVKKNYTLPDMPSQRAAGIVNVSFTMPAGMKRALEARARRDMTNKSEIVRRAIMAYLPPAEASAIMSGVMNETAGEYRTKKLKP